MGGEVGRKRKGAILNRITSIGLTVKGTLEQRIREPIHAVICEEYATQMER